MKFKRKKSNDYLANAHKAWEEKQLLQERRPLVFHPKTYSAASARMYMPTVPGASG